MDGRGRRTGGAAAADNVPYVVRGNRHMLIGVTLGPEFPSLLGALIGLGVLEMTPIWIAASIGALLGDSFSYYLGRRYREGVEAMVATLHAGTCPTDAEIEAALNELRLVLRGGLRSATQIVSYEIPHATALLVVGRQLVSGFSDGTLEVRPLSGSPGRGRMLQDAGGGADGGGAPASI